MKRVILLLKGLAMGGADVIPGVSGGTIALITGIYEELIRSIKSIDGGALKLLAGLRIRELWIRINGPFLVNVFAGVAISIFSLARLITYLMEHEPIMLWSFFFGLILVSAFYVIPAERKWTTWIFILLGAAIAYLITTLTPASTPDAYWFVFLSGAIAICAMILPGISGAFILLLLGKYEFVLGAVKSFDVVTIAVFMAGCLLGIISFSKVIYWLLQHHKNTTLATLAGFMLGSLNKIWPWKQEVDGIFINLSPDNYTTVTGQPNELYLAIVFFLLGIAIVVSLEWIGKKLTE